MEYIKYYIQLTFTLPLLYLINSSMIEFRFPKKTCRIVILCAILSTYMIEGIFFHCGIDTIEIYSYGPFTTVLPSFLSLLYLARHRDRSFLFIYLTETVLASITTSLSYLLSYYIPGKDWIVQTVLHFLLLIMLYVLCKYVLSQKFQATVNNYSVKWEFYMVLPIAYLIIWNMFLHLPTQLNNTPGKVKLPYMTYVYPGDIPLILFLLITSFYAIILMMSIIIKNYSFFEEQEQKNALAFQIESLKNLQAHYTEKNNSLRIFRHDMRHHFNTITLLLENNEVKKAQTYVNSISNTLATTKAVFYCNNAIINSLLSYYSEKCKTEMISITCKVLLPDDSYIEQIDTALGAVLSNILENALFAAMKVPSPQQRSIDFLLIQQNELFILQCKNSFHGNIMLGNDGRPRSKEKGHGIGTQSILAFEKTYQANTTYSVDKQVFTICMLFNKQDHRKTNSL